MQNYKFQKRIFKSTHIPTYSSDFLNGIIGIYNKLKEFDQVCYRISLYDFLYNMRKILTSLKITIIAMLNTKYR